VLLYLLRRAPLVRHVSLLWLHGVAREHGVCSRRRLLVVDWRHARLLDHEDLRLHRVALVRLDASADEESEVDEPALGKIVSHCPGAIRGEREGTAYVSITQKANTADVPCTSNAGYRRHQEPQLSKL
jgi:hypothetical protein